ncbi:hypothetical protein LTR50_005107 [Elasticomyces elasticus]|nr:hypothetical protein LTR50_005107 [Elasticomyces elasticus]
MFRTGATRALFRTGNAFVAAPRTTNIPFQLSSKLCTLSKHRPQGLARPIATSLVRFASFDPMDKIDKKREEQISAQKLNVSPDTVTMDSSTHPIFGEVNTEEVEKDTDMMAGVRNDLKTIKDTFSLQDVPTQAYYIGMAGVLPYLATSLSTVYCAWEINHNANYGTGFLMSDHTAELALHILEPLQAGYGAVIISFLGAIHWGLEFAGYGGSHGYRRYAIGVVAPAVAWPTILLPAEYALITQFLAFNFLYYVDSRATRRGWAPPWYSVYRFVLTFVVGASIVVSLVGRGQIADQIGKMPGPADRIKALRDSQMQALEDEEKARRARTVKEEEEDDDE